MSCEIFNSGREKVLSTLNFSEASLSSGVSIIKEWLKQQKHLPEVSDDVLIEKFLLLNKLSIELTKEKLDMYYTIRSLIPELYEKANPKLPNIKEVADSIYFVNLPKLMDEGYSVNVCKLMNSDINNFNTADFFAHSLNVVEVKLLEEYACGEVFIYDLQGGSLRHLHKINPMILQKMRAVAEKVFSVRIKGIHYINCPPFVDSLLTLVKGLISPKLCGRLHVHNSLDSLYQHIPKAILPKDYGGEQISMQELREKQKAKFEIYGTRFQKLDSMRVDESLRPKKLENDEILGFHGNFRRLDVD